MPFIVKLKNLKANTLTLARFDARPSWGDLASEIADLFSISSNNVGVVFIDEAKNAIILTKEQELQSLYKAFNPSSGKLKFVVQDLQNPDSPTTIASTWSDNKPLTLACWVLNVSNSPFAVEIRKSKTVDHLKDAIKKKKEHTFGAIDADTLQLWKLSPPIPSAEIGTKLRDVQSPQQIPGCDKLSVFDELSEHFSLAPRGHLHIIVEAPFTLSLSLYPTYMFSTITFAAIHDLEKQHARSVQQGIFALTPSSGARVPHFKHEQEKKPVMNGRPAENYGLHVHLFHPAFSLFQRTLADPNINFSSNDYTKARIYMSASAALYETESLRYDETLVYLAEAIQFCITQSADGSFLVTTSNLRGAIAGLYKLKNEIGAGSSDSTIQGSLLYRKAWVSGEVCLCGCEYCTCGRIEGLNSIIFTLYA